MDSDFPRWQITLDVVKRGDVEPRQLVFRKDEITIGRVRSNDLPLSAGNVSKRHCMLQIDAAGRVWASDLGSCNGTYLNGKRFDTTLFDVGDRLHVGDYRVTLVCSPEPTDVVLARSAAIEAGRDDS